MRRDLARRQMKGGQQPTRRFQRHAWVIAKRPPWHVREQLPQDSVDNGDAGAAQLLQRPRRRNPGGRQSVQETVQPFHVRQTIRGRITPRWQLPQNRAPLASFQEPWLTTRVKRQRAEVRPLDRSENR